MDLTFQELYENTQLIINDDSPTTLGIIKRDLNRGASILSSEIKRYYTRLEKLANLVVSQTDYQIPEDAIRGTIVSVLSGSIWYPVIEINDEFTWDRINATSTTTASIAQYYFIKGRDVLCLWPAPAANVANGLRLSYEPKQQEMLQADVTTGTVTLTNGSTTVTHSGTSFTQSMIGRTLKTTDGSDGVSYRIAGFTSNSVVTLENYYQGIGGAGKTYRIGESPQLPGEYHDSLVDYAAYRYNMRKGDSGVAREFKALFDDAKDRIKNEYSSKTSSSIISSRRVDYRNMSPLYRIPDVATGT